jgi:hypothetical protein
MTVKLTLSQLEQYLSKAAWILKGPVLTHSWGFCGKSSIFQQHQECSEISFRAANRAEIN